MTVQLVALRVPDLAVLEAGQVRLPTLAEAAERWRESRIDVDEQTAEHAPLGVRANLQGRPGAGRPSPRRDHRRRRHCARRRARCRAGYKRETIRKTRTALAQVLDYYGVDPNPARDQRVKLPKERKAHIPPPLAEHVERVAETVAREYVLPLLVIDECGPARERARDGARSATSTSTAARSASAGRSRRTTATGTSSCPTTCSPRSLATLPPREDRDLEAPLFPGLTDARLRMAITRACKATGTPHFSPHGLRRRRGSLHYKRTGSLAEVAELLGDSKRVAADHYVYALTDYREVDRSIALGASAWAGRFMPYRADPGADLVGLKRPICGDVRSQVRPSSPAKPCGNGLRQRVSRVAEAVKDHLALGRCWVGIRSEGQSSRRRVRLLRPPGPVAVVAVGRSGRARYCQRVRLRRDAKLELLKGVPLFAKCSKAELRRIAMLAILLSSALEHFAKSGPALSNSSLASRRSRTR